MGFERSPEHNELSNMLVQACEDRPPERTEIRVDYDIGGGDDVEHHGARVRCVPDPAALSARCVPPQLSALAVCAYRAVSGGSSGAAAPAAAAAGGLSEPPQPYTGASQGELHQDTMMIHGVRITYGAHHPRCMPAGRHCSCSRELLCRAAQSFGIPGT